MKKILALLLVSMMTMSAASVFAENEDAVAENTDEVTVEVEEDAAEVAEEGEEQAVEANTTQFISNFDDDDDDVKVYINNNRLRTDVPAQIISDRTMLPMRAIFEVLGCQVTWAENVRSIMASRDGDENTAAFIVMGIGNPEMSVTIGNGEPQTIALDVPPQIVDDRTLVPVRAVSEALNCKVSWDGDTRSVYITK